MSNIIRNLFAAALLIQYVNFTAAEQVSGYVLNAGDTVHVSAWREDAVQKEVKVLPDGSITVPLVGRIDVKGLSTQAAEGKISEALKKFIPDPIVTIVVTAVDGNKAYVLGRVQKPGPLVMTSQTTILQALSMAGGLDKFADENGIKIIRYQSSGVQEVIYIKYKELISGSNLSSNVYLKAGDTILVP